MRYPADRSGLARSRPDISKRRYDEGAADAAIRWCWKETPVICKNETMPGWILGHRAGYAGKKIGGAGASH